MASRNYHKNQLKKRQKKKAETRYVEALRREAVRYEGVTERGAARLSKERLQEVIRLGKLRKGITGAPVGSPLALAAAALLRRG
jgi:hypothetical protein